MSASASKARSSKVWHVNVHNRTLCRGTNITVEAAPLIQTIPLNQVPAYGLCQHCERAVEQIAAAVREIQS